MTSPGKQLVELIDRAAEYFERCGESCAKDPEIAELLSRFRGLIDEADAAMLRLGVVAECSRCAETGKGSCCFREMGESYGLAGLFINLLLGSNLPKSIELPGSCHFVGGSGCKLQARQSFCLNYFCPDLEKALGEKTILDLQRLIGEQLRVGWELERTVTKRLAELF